MARISKQQFERALPAGATVTTDDCAIMVDAPSGKVWACDISLHCIVAQAAAPWSRASDKSGAYADLIERMRYGVVDCDDPDCDVCTGA